MARTSRKAPPKPRKSQGGKQAKGRKAAPSPARRKKRDYAAEYRARTKGLKPGTPEYQRARGHVAREHITRHQREQALIDQFAVQQAWRGEKHGARPAEEIADWIREEIKTRSYHWFVEWRKTRDDLHRQYVANKHKSLGIDLGALAAQLGVPHSELFYH
jgi:hypothetical protein